MANTQQHIIFSEVTVLVKFITKVHYSDSVAQAVPAKPITQSACNHSPLATSDHPQIEPNRQRSKRRCELRSTRLPRFLLSRIMG
jgi:hypothetical protein